MAEHRRTSVRELLDRFDSHELSEWKAYYSLYPEPQEREDMRAGHIAANMFNTWKTSAQSAQSASDYVWKLPEPEESVESRVNRTMQTMSMLRQR